MNLKPSCFFWDGQECHYEPLILGSQPCKECPPEDLSADHFDTPVNCTHGTCGFCMKCQNIQR